MSLYEEVDNRRAERYAMRIERRAMETESNRRAAYNIVQIVAFAAMIYAMLFIGCLWA